MNGNSFLQVEKFWLDPKNIMSPIKIENVLGYYFVPSDNDALDVFLKKIIPMNIETLSINVGELNKPWNFDWILSFRNLKKLTIKSYQKFITLDFDPSHMFDVLKKMNGMKMIQLADCWLKNDFFFQFLVLVIFHNSFFGNVSLDIQYNQNVHKIS